MKIVLSKGKKPLVILRGKKKGVRAPMKKKRSIAKGYSNYA